jgi:hypothetical protein
LGRLRSATELHEVGKDVQRLIAHCVDRPTSALRIDRVVIVGVVILGSLSLVFVILFLVLVRLKLGIVDVSSVTTKRFSSGGLALCASVFLPPCVPSLLRSRLFAFPRFSDNLFSANGLNHSLSCMMYRNFRIGTDASVLRWTSSI